MVVAWEEEAGGWGLGLKRSAAGEGEEEKEIEERERKTVVCEGEVGGGRGHQLVLKVSEGRRKEKRVKSEKE